MVSSFQVPLRSARVESVQTTEGSKSGFPGEPKVCLVRNPASSGGSKQPLGKSSVMGAAPSVLSSELLPHSTSLHVRDCFSSHLSTAMHRHGNNFPTALPTSNTTDTLTVALFPFLTMLYSDPVLWYSLVFAISHFSISHINYGITFSVLQDMAFFPGTASDALENPESDMSGPGSSKLELSLTNNSCSLKDAD